MPHLPIKVITVSAYGNMCTQTHTAQTHKCQRLGLSEWRSSYTIIMSIIHRTNYAVFGFRVYGFEHFFLSCIENEEHMAHATLL